MKLIGKPDDSVTQYALYAAIFGHCGNAPLYSLRGLWALTAFG